MYVLVTFLNWPKTQRSSLQERPVLAHDSGYSFHHGEDGTVATVALCCGKKLQCGLSTP